MLLLSSWTLIFMTAYAGAVSPPLLRILITGANRGIGLGLTKALLAHPHVGSCVATCRNLSSSPALRALSCDKLTLLELDVADESSQQRLSRDLDDLGFDAIDVCVCNHGVSNKNHPHDPFLTSKVADLLECFKVNAVGTMLTLQLHSPRLFSSRAKLAVILSSRLASIEQASGGGYTSYRASKAAVNMLAATYVADGAVKAAGVRCLLVHPGWVQTDMGNAGGRSAPVTVEQSAAGILSQIMRGVSVQLRAPMEPAYDPGSFEQLLMSNHLVFTAFDGELLPY